MSAEDRVHAATEATAASVRQIRPLALPDASAAQVEPPGHRDRGVRRGRGLPRAGGAPGFGGSLARARETWLIPLGAAAVVAVLAVSLVMLRHAAPPGSGPAPSQPAAAAPAVTDIPRYYALAYQGKESHEGKAAVVVTVGDVRTGKAIGTVSTPAVYVGGESAVTGVSATADDRSFVVGTRNIYGGIAYFLVRIAPGTSQPATIEPVPVPQVDPGDLLGFAVSPDGRQLAALSARGNGTSLNVYSTTSGATLRTWTAPTWHYLGTGTLTAGVSWTGDSRQVAFSTVVTTLQYVPPGGALQERVISATAPSGDLAAASKSVFKAPGNCSSLLLTPDGGTVVCGTQVNYPIAAGSAGCEQAKPMFAAYSAATGKLLRVLYQSAEACYQAVYTVLWADNAARQVVGETQRRVAGQAFINRYGVAGAGQFTKFPVIPPLSQWYSEPAF